MQIERNNPFDVFQTFLITGRFNPRLPNSVLKIVKFYIDQPIFPRIQRIDDHTAALQNLSGGKISTIKGPFPKECTIEKVDNNKFLIIGGSHEFKGFHYCAKNTTWLDLTNEPPRITKGPQLNNYRAFHNSLLLSNGDILVFSGVGKWGSTHMPAEVYSKEKKVWEVVDEFVFRHTTTMSDAGCALKNNKAFISSAESTFSQGDQSGRMVIFDGNTKQFALTSPFPTTPCDFQAVAPLKDGALVLLAGGKNKNDTNPAETKAALLDTETLTWKSVAPMNVGRINGSVHTPTPTIATVYGGFNEHNLPVSSCDVYDLNKNTWTLYEGGLEDPAYKQFFLELFSCK